MTISPLARPFPDLMPIAGVRIGTAAAGYKNWQRADVTLIELSPGTTVAGVLTQSRCPSPEVELCRARLPGGHARGVVINAGNSNAFTGLSGREAAAAQTDAAARLLGCPPGEVFAASTGVIGVPLPQAKAVAGVTAAHAALGDGDFHAATLAIGTTDTFAKAATTVALIGETRITLTGFIKGSGMIAPDMATMLGFIFTDAAVAPDFLQAALSKANGRTFSCITVDGDTSTSDTVLAFATGTAGNAELTSWDSPGADAFAAALHDLCRQLAQLVVRDGEGATKFITITVEEGRTRGECMQVAKAVANSPLVKTAFFASDPNLGRILAAIGNAGIVDLEPGKVGLHLGAVKVVEHGARAATYTEEQGKQAMKPAEIPMRITLGRGVESATALTCCTQSTSALGVGSMRSSWCLPK